MDLKKQQMMDQNRTASMISLFIEVSMIVISVLSFNSGARGAMVVRMVLIVAALLLNVLGYRVLKTSVFFRHLICITTFAAYLSFVFTYDDAFAYMYIFPIAMMIMIFQDAKVIKISASISVVAAVIYFAIFHMRFPDKIQMDQIILSMIIVVVSATISCVTISLGERHAQERMAQIEEQAAAEAEVAAEIVHHSKDLAEQFRQAMAVSEKLNECMTSSHTSVSEIADSTRLTAEAIERQTAQTMDIQHHVQDVDERTRHIAELSAATKEVVEQGVDLIEQLKQQATEVAKISHETEQTTKNLNNSIKEVEAITETILGISSQTNLLALNASIEAARAGEAGKGFAVVADEIRNLSEGTKEATEQITQIISRLTGDAQSASESMSKSAVYSEKQNEMITVTGKKLTDIQNNTDELNENVMQVSQAVENVVQANTAISDSISNLSATSEEVAASTESSLTLSDSSMQSLHEMTELLQEIYNISESMMKLSQTEK